jgi:CelD/BcsL family acetyltransferase involved in cellulose biosynthesis
VEIRVIRDSETLTALQPEWLDLWRRSPNATPFQSPMWLLPWWRHFGSNDLHVIEFREDGRLEALAPLYILRDDCESLGLFLGTGISDYLDVLGDQSFIEEIAKVDCQTWDLQQLRASSPMLNEALPNGWTDNVDDQDPCLVLALSQLSLSTHFQKKLRYYRRQLGDATFEEANAENLNELLQSLFDLHAARWQRRGMPGMLADDVIQEFHREVAKAMLDADTLRMYAIRSARRIVAAFYGFAGATTIYYYLSGYDPELEKLSPGTLIIAHAVECAVRDGATTFDFLRGAEEYKSSWGAKPRMNRRRQLMKV